MDAINIKAKARETDIFRQQLKKAPLIRDFNKYFKDKFTDDERAEYEQAIHSLPTGSILTIESEIESRIRAANQDFMLLKEVPDQYLSHDENATDIMRTIERLTGIYDRFKKNYYQEQTDRYKEPENALQLLEDALEELPPELAIFIIEEMRADLQRYNIHLYLQEGKEADKWETLRDTLLMGLKKMIKQIEAAPVEAQEKSKRKSFDYFVLPDFMTSKGIKMPATRLKNDLQNAKDKNKRTIVQIVYDGIRQNIISIAEGEGRDFFRAIYPGITDTKADNMIRALNEMIDVKHSE